MSWCDRRALLTGLAAAAVLPACRFEPALTSGAGSGALYGNIQVEAPGSGLTFVLTRRLEDRLGRGTAIAPYTLDYGLSLSSQRLGTDRQGSEQRVHLDGRATYVLRRRADEAVLAEGEVAQFTGYSTTGNTVSTSAAREDARRRLAIMLADAIAARILQTPLEPIS